MSKTINKKTQWKLFFGGLSMMYKSKPTSSVGNLIIDIKIHKFFTPTSIMRHLHFEAKLLKITVLKSNHLILISISNLILISISNIWSNRFDILIWHIKYLIGWFIKPSNPIWFWYQYQIFDPSDHQIFWWSVITVCIWYNRFLMCRISFDPSDLMRHIRFLI